MLVRGAYVCTVSDAHHTSKFAERLLMLIMTSFLLIDLHILQANRSPLYLFQN